MKTQGSKQLADDRQLFKSHWQQGQMIRRLIGEIMYRFPRVVPSIVGVAIAFTLLLSTTAAAKAQVGERDLVASEQDAGLAPPRLGANRGELTREDLLSSDPLDVIDPNLLPKDGAFVPAPREELAEASARANSSTIWAGDCGYQQAIDNAHLSGGVASTHGSWLSVGGTCPSKANVDTYLQGYWCGGYGCYWITVASNSGDVSAGGGRGNRVTARRTCGTTNSSGWRSFVDVDLIGVSDPSGYTYSPARNFNCTPS